MGWGGAEVGTDTQARGSEGGVGKVQEFPWSLVSVVIKAGRLLALPVVSLLLCCPFCGLSAPPSLQSDSATGVHPRHQQRVLVLCRLI